MTLFGLTKIKTWHCCFKNLPIFNASTTPTYPHKLQLFFYNFTLLAGWECSATPVGDGDVFGALPAGDDEGGARGELVGDVGEIDGLEQSVALLEWGGSELRAEREAGLLEWGLAGGCWRRRDQRSQEEREKKIPQKVNWPKWPETHWNTSKFNPRWNGGLPCTGLHTSMRFSVCSDRNETESTTLSKTL